MGSLPKSTEELLLSGLMGILGGLVTIPINAAFSWWLKRDELRYQHKLDMIAKQRELLLQHKLEMARKARDNELDRLKEIVAFLEQSVTDWEQRLVLETRRGGGGSE